jgi:putative endonuclease
MDVWVIPLTAPHMFRWLNQLLGRAARQEKLGGQGESIAARFLRGLGYKILVRNYKSGVGEIDIIARDGDMLVFVEVKTRRYDQPTPEEQVNPAKQRQLTKAAKVYVSRYGFPQPPSRFDVVAIVWPEGAAPEVRHIKSAFEAAF